MYFAFVSLSLNTYLQCWQSMTGRKLNLYYTQTGSTSANVLKCLEISVTSNLFLSKFQTDGRLSLYESTQRACILKYVFFCTNTMDNFPQKPFFNIFHVAGIHTGVPHSTGRRLRMSIPSRVVSENFSQQNHIIRVFFQPAINDMCKL